MADDLQQIYTKYIPQEHWLEILPKQTIVSRVYSDEDGDADMDATNEQLQSHVSFSNYTEILEISAQILKVQMH
jgi:hypothetical protein